MLESQPGPFKPFSVLWIPFSVPACLLGMAAWALFVATNAGLAAGFDVAADTRHALSLFAANLLSGIFRFRVVPGSGWLFLCQSISALLLWSVFGVGMSRCFAVRLARDEYIGLKDALVFGWRQAGTAMLYPVI
ncbi:MAG: hypothetical protein KDB53_01710, partial [Planctomycetes bacterium]|nr:hypothetical protein [Planctomycetota bacterium]